MTEQSREQRGVSRRTIAKGAAWTVPVAAVAAVPARAFAFSGGPPTVALGDACKLPGASCSNVFIKGYIFDVTITNNTDKSIWLYNEPDYEITFQDGEPDLELVFQAAVDLDGNVISFPYEIEPGDAIALIFNAGDGDNSKNYKDLEVTICVPWGHTEDPADEPDVHEPACDTNTYPSTPPEANPSCAVILPPDCGKTAL